MWKEGGTSGAVAVFIPPPHLRSVPKKGGSLTFGGGTVYGMLWLEIQQDTRYVNKKLLRSIVYFGSGDASELITCVSYT